MPKIMQDLIKQYVEAVIKKVPVPGKKQCQGKVHLIKYVQNVNMHEKLLLSEYSDKYLQKQALKTA